MSEQTPSNVFTPDEVANLWRHQFEGTFHPFTCANRHDHPVIAGDRGVLVPTTRGWICPICDYTQTWAHGFMKAARTPTQEPNHE